MRLRLDCTNKATEIITDGKKRAGYRHAYDDFDVQRVATISEDALKALRSDKSIIRNRLKIYVAGKDACAKE